MTDFGVDNLTVRLGHHLAVDGVSLTVPAGSIAAVVGGDGAGKTTLLRVLTGGLAPTSGRVRRPESERIGYVATGTGYYPDLTVDENLSFWAHAYDVPASTFPARRDELLKRTDLDAFGDRLAGQLSGGQRQKLALALAFVHDPELLVLDEPTTGVDPVSRAELWRMIAHVAAHGAGVVVASSYLDEAERAERVLVLDQGRTLLDGTPDEIVASMPGRVVELDRPVDRARAWRRGRRFRQWLPDGDDTSIGNPVPLELADAVVVAALGAQLGRAS